MNIGGLLRDFLIMSALVLVVSAIVSYLYSLVVHGLGIIDWEGSIRFAIIIGIVLPSIQEIERRKKTEG